MQHLSPIDQRNIDLLLHFFSSSQLFMVVFQSLQPGQPDLANKLIKQWRTIHQNPTWEALVALLKESGAFSAAHRIKTIIPTYRPPAPVHAAPTKK